MQLAHRRGPAGPEAERRAASDDRGERGSVLILVAICLTVLVTATALTVDLGRISTARRDLQKVADVVALDLSRRLDGRTTSQVLADPDFSATRAAALARNGFPLTGTNHADVSLGFWDPVTQVFRVATAAERPTAVRVVTTQDVDFQFAPGKRTTSRTGVAGQTAAAGFSVGSFAARLDTQQSALLNPLLGDALGVTAIGYDGLAGGNVNLGLLATQLGLSVGSPTQLLGTSVRLVDLVRAEAEVLRAGGDLARARLLDDLALALPNPNLPILLGNVLTIFTGGEGAAGLANLDALELLTTVAYIANGTNFLDLPDIGLTLPGGLVTTAAQLQVIEAPRWKFGPVGTQVDTAQVTLKVQVASSIPGVSSTTITLNLTSASARGTSTAIGCNRPQQLDLDVRTALVTTRADVAADLSVLGIPVAKVKLHATSGTTPTNRAFAFDFPPDAFGVHRQVPTPGLNLGGAALVTDEISVIGLPLPGVVTGAVGALTSGVVTPLLTALDDALITPLASLLGLTVAGADVTPLSIACSGPKLVG